MVGRLRSSSQAAFLDRKPISCYYKKEFMLQLLTLDMILGKLAGFE